MKIIKYHKFPVTGRWGVLIKNTEGKYDDIVNVCNFMDIDTKREPSLTFSRGADYDIRVDRDKLTQFTELLTTLGYLFVEKSEYGHIND